MSVVLLIQLFILYLNGDPRPFLRATNKTIINYGLWLQIESAMLLSECEFVSKSKSIFRTIFIILSPISRLLRCSYFRSHHEHHIVQIHMAIVVQV